MSLTVNLKPAGLRPVGGGELIYQWTESDLTGKPNYRVQLEFNGLGLPLFEFRPDEDSIIRANIAPILRSVLALSVDIADRFNDTYVSYQAVWTGGSDSQVDLSSDVIYFYVGNNNYLNNRTVFGMTTADGQSGPPFGTYPDGPTLLHQITSREADTSFPAYGTPSRGFIGWLDREFVFEFLHENIGTLCAIHVTRPDGTTLLNFPFNGTTPSMRHVTFVPDVVGQYSIGVQSITAGGYVYWGRLTVKEPCENPVYLQWINDYGGLERYLFSQNQISQLDPQVNAKYLFKTVFASNLTYEEWIKLSELFRDGAIYNDARRIGQFVQDITNYDPDDSSGDVNIFDVIVSPVTTSRAARQKKSEVTIQVRYPAMDNSEVT